MTGPRPDPTNFRSLPPGTLTVIPTGLFEYGVVRGLMKLLGILRCAAEGRIIDVALIR